MGVSEERVTINWRRLVPLLLFVVIVGSTIMMLFVGKTAVTTTTTRPANVTPITTTSPTATCNYDYSVDYCDEKGCVLAVTVNAERSFEARVDGGVWKINAGYNRREFRIPWNSTLSIESPCFSLNYTPQLYYTVSATVREYDVETGRKTVEVAAEFSLPLRGEATVGRQTLLLFNTKRLTAVTETYGNEVAIRAGPIATVVNIPEPVLSLNVSAYFDGLNYVYNVRYVLTGADSARWGWRTLSRSGELQVTSRDKMERFCLGKFCAPVRWVAPRVEVSAVNYYYVHYFPVVMLRVTNPGPAYWEGEVRFNSITKIDTCFETADGRVCSDSLNKLLWGAELKQTPFTLALRPGQAATLAIITTSDVRVGNITIRLPPLPEVAVTNTQCQVQRLPTPRPIGPGNATSLYICNATLIVKPNGYIVVDPVITINRMTLYMPRVAVAKETAITIATSLPYEVRAQDAFYFAARGYVCANNTCVFGGRLEVTLR